MKKLKEMWLFLTNKQKAGVILTLIGISVFCLAFVLTGMWYGWRLPLLIFLMISSHGIQVYGNKLMKRKE